MTRYVGPTPALPLFEVDLVDGEHFPCLYGDAVIGAALSGR